MKQINLNETALVSGGSNVSEQDLSKVNTIADEALSTISSTANLAEAAITNVIDKIL